jgi:hypothetical protein
MAFSPLLRLPEIYETSPQWAQAANDANYALECATNDITILDMSTGDKLLGDVEQLRSFLWVTQNVSINRTLTLSEKVDLVSEARRFVAISNEGPADLTVKVNSNATWSDTISAGASRLYYIKGNSVRIIGSYGLASTSPSMTYDVSIFVSGQPPVVDEIYRQAFTQDVRFDGNFLGSRATARINPTANAQFIVKKNGTQVGVVTLTSSGTHTFTTTGGNPVLMAPGSFLTVTPPNPQDASLADVGITLAGTKL